jgi:NifU-like protein involved in Fe-S cluster formation
MSQDLYNDAILREAKGSAAASTRLESPDLTVTLDNPLCGDRVTLDLRLAEVSRVVVAEVGHKTRGCMLTQAAASVLARRAPGATTDELRAVVRGLEASLRGAAEPESTWPELEMFRAVHAIRSRHECVLLPFHAIEDALAQAEKRP